MLPQIPYSKARDLIKEADVLLFRSKPFPSPGWFISFYGRGPYSHVGLAHWDRGRLYCVEHREFKGGRSILLSTQVNQQNIDVFRLPSKIVLPKFENGSIINSEVQMTKSVANSITDSALVMTGLPYSWLTIFKMAKTYLPFVRLAQSYKAEIDDNFEIDCFVCSTLVASSIRKNYIDILPLLSDNYVKPNDLARSSYLTGLFSLTRG